jgi:cystathionine beta-lyase family protein involved in aluminum resistance
MKTIVEAILDRFRFDAAVERAARDAAVRCAAPSADRAAVDAKLLRAFADARIDASDLAGTLGYGYGDPARDRYEAVLALALDAEAALARLSLVSGTHAIVTALDTFAAPGATLLCVTGPPYDTLQNAIAKAPGSLVERGVRYAPIALAPEGDVDDAAVLDACDRLRPAVAFIQRSRGYAARRSLSARRCGDLALRIKQMSATTIVVVDNCYGELVDAIEPTGCGADLIAGSLIKNLGGGIAPGGGYVAGRADLLERVAVRHYAPGLGAHVGSSLGFGRLFVQGLFLAPLAVREALAGLCFAAAMFESFGYAVSPGCGGERHDIVQAIGLGDEARLLAFARGLQTAMPLDARFAPEPGPVPGYPEPVVMSSGAFVAGATIELSCDAPLRPPYEVYLQGGLRREHAVFGALAAAGRLAQEKLLAAPKTLGSLWTST